MDVKKDYYKILGVDKNATQDEIKKAYRNLSKTYHPDVQETGNEEKFKEANEANSVLSNDEERQKYDMMSPNGKSYNPGFGGGFSSFGGGFSPFGDPFGSPDDFINRIRNEFFRQGRQEEFYEELDVQRVLELDLRDIYNNKPIDIVYDRFVYCGTCSGTGFDPKSESFKCDVCEGKGHDNHRVRCKYCQGTGSIHSGKCPNCGGEKVVNSKGTFKISNIYTLTGRVTKYFSGYGHCSKYYKGKVGNLALHINFVDDDRYIRTQQGLYYPLDLHYEDAINGATINYEHLDSKTYKIKIPVKTKDGDVIRMPNKGLLIDGKTRQHLFFKINVIIDYDRLDSVKGSAVV